MAGVSFCAIPLIWMSMDLTNININIDSGAVRQQATTVATVDLDLWRHISSMGYNELIAKLEDSQHYFRLREFLSLK